MKLTKRFLAGALCFSLNLAVFAAVVPAVAFGQDAKVALQRGYRTGYSDGYMAGYRDSIDNEAREFARHGDYEKASRAFNSEYGTIEDYRDGYRQGFELGYAAGYDKKSFEAKVPETLSRRGLTAVASRPPSLSRKRRRVRLLRRSSPKRPNLFPPHRPTRGTRRTLRRTAPVLTLNRPSRRSATQ